MGCSRFIYNYILAKSKENYEKDKVGWNAYDYIKLLPKLKKEYPFLKEVDSQSLQQTILNLNDSFKRFFKKQSKFPVFKKKKNSGSFKVGQYFKIIDNKIKIPKLKSLIKVKMDRKIEGEIKNLTITKTTTDKYYVSITVVKEIKKKPIINKIAGIDLGLKDFATITTGINEFNYNSYKIGNQKTLSKYAKRLKRLQRQLSKKQHPTALKKISVSNNFKKQSKKVAKVHEKISNVRNDFLHKLSSTIINENQVIVVEDLNIKGMLRNHHLAKSISDVSWYTFISMLKYKSQWYGRQIIEADRYYPSSKLCHNCGYKNDDLKLSDRIWICPQCGAILDRDINASINLYTLGLGQSEFTPVETNTVDEQVTVMLNIHPHLVVETGSFN